MASIDWHGSEDLLQAVQKFHDTYARQPHEKIAEVKARHATIMGEIRKQMRQRDIPVRFEYTGSTCEGTNVANGADDYDLDFDVMLIIDCRGTGLQVGKMKERRGCYAWLKIQEATEPSIPLGHFELNYLNAVITADKFFDELQKCINDSPKLSEAVTLRRDGPTAQIDVFKVGSTTVFYSVNVVPTYEVVGERYVATSLIERNYFAWRRSFSIEEKEILLGADGDNGCRKKVFRILKVIRNREPGLAQLTSYHLKTALFLEMKEVKSRWSEDNIGRRLMGVLGHLEKCLTAGNLPHNFLGSKVNLLSSIPPEVIENIRDRVRHLLSSESEIKGILSVEAAPE